MATTRTSRIEKNFSTKEIGKKVVVDTVSTNPDDFIKTLNEVSPQIKGITNLGIFADVTEIKQHDALVGTAENEFLEITKSNREVPGNSLIRDNSSSDIRDYQLSDLAEESNRKASDKEITIDTKGEGFQKVIIGSRTRAILSTLNDFQCNPSTRCTKCAGSGQCRDCRGQGETRCSNCAGSGQTKCGKCGGAGRCKDCAGRGENRCIRCNGSGRGSGGFDCTLCGGSGWTKCFSCSGSGSCSTCKGSGTESCFYCAGSGTHMCLHCLGSGKCKGCKGSGEITCERCQGTGWYQTYQVINTNINAKRWEFSGSTELSGVLGLATGKKVYSGAYKQWDKIGELKFDKTEDVYNAGAQSFPEEQALVEEFKKAYASVKKLDKADNNEVPYKQSVNLRKVNITSIYYKIDDKNYSLHIMGDNHVVAYTEVPKVISAYKENVSNSLQNRMTNYARTIAFCKLAAYIFQCDGLDPKESHLLGLFVDDLQLSKDARSKFMGELKQFGPKMLYSDFRKHIKILFSSKKTLSFAWQCMAVDKTISREEEKLFEKLTQEFKVTKKEIESIKRYATRFSYLDPKDIVNEYLGRSLNSKGGGWRGKFASWLYLNKGWLLIVASLLACALFLVPYIMDAIDNSTRDKGTRTVTPEHVVEQIIAEPEVEVEVVPEAEASDSDYADYLSMDSIVVNHWIPDFINNYYFWKKDKLEACCTPKLLQKLEDLYPTEHEGVEYAGWLFRLDYRDNQQPKGPQDGIISVTAKGDGWYEYEFYEEGWKGRNLVRMVVSEEGALLFDELYNLYNEFDDVKGSVKNATEVEVKDVVPEPSSGSIEDESGPVNEDAFFQ